MGKIDYSDCDGSAYYVRPEQQAEKERYEQIARDNKDYQTILVPFIKAEMPGFVSRISWELGQQVQVSEGEQVERKINDAALVELLKLTQRLTELMPSSPVNKTAFQEDFYHKIEPLFKEIWLKVTGTDTLSHIMGGCRAFEKEAFLEKFKAETQACQTFQPAERDQLGEFISKVYVLIYDDKRTF